MFFLFLTLPFDNFMRIFIIKIDRSLPVPFLHEHHGHVFAVWSNRDFSYEHNKRNKAPQTKLIRHIFTTQGWIIWTMYCLSMEDNNNASQSQHVSPQCSTNCSLPKPLLVFLHPLQAAFIFFFFQGSCCVSVPHECRNSSTSSCD